MHDSTGPSASIVIPTRARPDYLAVALASIAPQAEQAGAEVLVIDDAGASPAVGAIARRFGARYEPHTAPRGLNAARNTGVRLSHGELVVFVDDDVRVAPGWLEALLTAARRYPAAEVFAGPIRAHLEGSPPRTCGREAPPLTTLDLGSSDTDTVRCAWGANMAVRQRAFARVGLFDTSIVGGGDEQEWQERLLRERGAGAPDHIAGRTDHIAGRIVYVAGAVLDHRRAADDTRLRALARTARTRGRAARRFDARRGLAPTLRGELRTLGGCLGHVVRRRCPAGLVMVAHSLGRLQECLRERRS